MTKKISEEKIIEDFRKIAEFELPEDMVRQDLDQLRRQLSEGALPESPADKNVWRKIMQSKCTKYVSAAMIFTAVFVGMQFLPSAELNAAQLLTKVSENMKNVKVRKWVTENYLPGKENAAGYVTSIKDYENQQVFLIYSEGYLHQWDYKKMISSVYRPEDNTMILKELKSEWSGPGKSLDTYIKKLAKEGLEVEQTEIIENGVEFAIIEYTEMLNDILPEPDKFESKMRMGGRPVKNIKVKLTINRDDLFLSRSESSYYDAQDNLIVTKKTTSELIDTAPADIYELGVPSDVKIINKIPDERVQEVRKQIETHKGVFLKNYIAVQAEFDVTEEKPRLMEGTVIYCKGKKIRVDSFRSIYPSDKKKPIPEEAKETVKASLARLEPYVSKTPRLRAIHLYDGLWQHIYEELDGKGGMQLRKPHRRPGGDLYGDDDIEDFGWRLLWLFNEPEWMYEDDFSKENGLIGMEITRQSQFGRLPERKVLYVDPAKDYLYRRYVEEKLIDAPWQIDKKWIDTAKNKEQLNEQVRVYEVVEYAQTENGQWYPKTFTTKGYNQRPLSKYPRKRDFDRICRIYLLEENPDLPDELFDPEILSGLDSSKL